MSKDTGGLSASELAELHRKLAAGLPSAAACAGALRNLGNAFAAVDIRKYFEQEAKVKVE